MQKIRRFDTRFDELARGKATAQAAERLMVPPETGTCLPQCTMHA